MQVNIVTNERVLMEIKKSKYFQKNLGFVSTLDKNGRRVFNDKDAFSATYNSNYKTTIYAQGKIGNIRFYTDYYITDKLVGVYLADSFEEFVVDFDYDKLKEKGIDGYLGYILKDCETQYEEMLKNNEIKKKETPKGDADKIVNNPGNVTWEDLKDFMNKKNRNQL
jgi:hypothetical protein